jgi:hypothetical protein
MTTVAQFIEDAARACRLVPEEQSIEPYQSQRGLKILRNILSKFSGAHVTTPYEKIVNFNTVVGQESYTNAPGSGFDINDNQIIDVMDVFATLNSVRYPITIINEKMYKNVVYPVAQGIPWMMLLRKFITSSTLIFQPVPAFVFDITLVCKQRLTTPNFNDDINAFISADWEDDLHYLVARDFMMYYSLPIPNQLFMERISIAEKDLKAQNNVDVFVEKQEILTQNQFYYPYILGWQ